MVMTPGQVARRLLRLLRPLAPLMVVSASARVVNQGLGVAIPALAAALVVGFEPGDGVGGLLLLLGGLALVKGLFRYVEQFTGHAVAFRLLAELRIEVYGEIVPLAPAGLEDDRTGDLVSRVIGDIDRVEPFYAHTIAPLTAALVVPLLASASLALWVDPLLGLVFLPFPLLMALVAPWVGAGRVAELSRLDRDQSGETAAIFTDAVQGARELAVFEAGETVAARIENRAAFSHAIRRRLGRFAAARIGLVDLAAGAAVVAMVIAGVTRLEAEAIDLARLGAAVVVGWVGTNPARAIEGIVPDLTQALAAASRLFELADREPPVSSWRGGEEDPDGGLVRFSGVSLTLGDEGSPTLDGIDATIPDRSYAAVVGPSGSGKSTLVELLVRFRDPDEGKVALGGTDLTEIDPARLRSQVTLVPQRPDIFFGSIADNLSLAKPGASHQEMWEALDRAALRDWVRSLDGGLDAAVGELGETMSGGQRQRLALARAFLRDPRVLILDEATSELDPAAERRVLAEISGERGRRTIVVVAHRLDTITDADQILVVDRGRLVERGRHEELLSAGGVYAGLWARHLDTLGTPA